MSENSEKTGAVHVRCLSDGTPGYMETFEWMRVIYKSNELSPGMFGTPTFLGPWWAGGTVEEYEDARVIHRVDPSVSIV